LLFALFARFILLEKIPTGMSDDEILFPLSSRSFFYTGKDLTEQWFPLSLTKPAINATQIYGKVPYILFSPFFGLVNFSMFTARFPYALLGGFFVLVMFFISKKLFPVKIALIISLLLAINPWSIFFSRTAYESPIGVYFAFLMFALLLYVKSWKILLAFPIYILSFYSYIGTPIVLPLFTTSIIIYCWLINKKKSTKYYFLFLLLAFSLLLFYMFNLKNDIGRNRIVEIINPNLPSITNDVNWNRRESISTPVMSLFINKFEASFKIFTSQYLGAFSPQYLFSEGEGQARFSLLKHGEFYTIDLIFIIIGFFYMLKNKPKQAMLLLILLLISPVPSAIFIGDPQYVLRASFMFPLLLIFNGYGIYSFVNIFKNKLMPTVIIITIYLILFVNFGYTYLFRNPIYNYDSFGISGRILSKYIQLAGTRKYKIQITSHGPNIGLFRQYLFFNNRYTKENHSIIASIFTNKVIAFDNVFFADCKELKFDKSIITIIPFNLKCTENSFSKNALRLTNYTDNQELYLIYNDKICENYNVLSYIDNLGLSDFNIEGMSEKRFCEKFFTKDIKYNSINNIKQ